MWSEGCRWLGIYREIENSFVVKLASRASRIKVPLGICSLII